MSAPTATVEIEFTAGAWTDVTAWVDGPIEIDRSASSVTEETQPGTCRFTLSCADPSTGAPDVRFLPDSPLGAYYPNVKEDKRVRVKVYDSSVWTRFTGWITLLDPVFGETLGESTVVVTAVDGLGRLGRLRSKGWTSLVTAGWTNTYVAPLATSLRVTGSPSWAALTKLGRWATYDTDALTPLDPSGCVRLESTHATDTVGFDASTFLFSPDAFAFWVKPIKGPVIGSGYSTDGAFFYDNNWLVRLTSELVIEVWYRGASPEVCFARYATGGAATHLAFRNGSGIYINGKAVAGTSFLSFGGVGYAPVFAVTGGSTTVQLSNLVSWSGGTALRVGLLAAGGGLATLADLVQALYESAGATVGVSADAGMGTKKVAGASLEDAKTALDLVRLIAASEGSPAWDGGTGVVFTERAYEAAPGLVVDLAADGDLSAGVALARTSEGRVSVGIAHNWRESKQETDAALAVDLPEVSSDVATVLDDELDLNARASLRISEGRDSKLRVSGLTFDFGTVPYRVNLVPNPSFEVNTTGWSVTANCTIARSTSFAYTGTASLAITAVASGTAQVSTPSGTSGLPVVAGTSYFIQSRMRATAASRTARLYVNWYTAAGAYVSTTAPAANTNLTSGAWVEVAATLTAPATAAFASLVPTLNNPAAAEVTYLDAVMVEVAANSSGGYFDGTTSGCEWTGTAHASASRTTGVHPSDVYALKPGKLVRVSGVTSSVLGYTYQDGRLLGMRETYEVGRASITLNLGTPVPGLPVGTARVGFGSGVATLTSAITSSGTSVSITFTGGNGLSTSAGDYPLDLDINGERVTVASAPAGAASPQTVTVTRGVAPSVARAHSAGEPVELWDVLRVGY